MNTLGMKQPGPLPIKLLFLLFSYETVYEEVTEKIGSAYNNTKIVPRQECHDVVVQEAGRWVFPPPLPPAVKEYDNKCPDGCDCVPFDSCQGSEFEDFFRKSGKQQRFQDQFCNIMPPRVCCCRTSRKLK